MCLLAMWEMENIACPTGLTTGSWFQQNSPPLWSLLSLLHSTLNNTTGTPWLVSSLWKIRQLFFFCCVKTRDAIQRCSQAEMVIMFCFRWENKSQSLTAALQLYNLQKVTTVWCTSSVKLSFKVQNRACTTTILRFVSSLLSCETTIHLPAHYD